MLYLNLLNINSTVFKKFASALLCLSLFACSTTEQVSNNNFIEDGYERGYVSENFTHSQFTPINSDSVKKPLLSDHHLMMALLNRPVTADQAMMLAFAQERSRYQSPYANYAVEIKGDKHLDETNSRSKNAYAQLISHDINAVSIKAPE